MRLKCARARRHRDRRSWSLKVGRGTTPARIALDRAQASGLRQTALRRVAAPYFRQRGNLLIQDSDPFSARHEVGSGVLRFRPTLSWREMDSNHQYRSQKPAISEVFPISRTEITAQTSAVTRSIASLRGPAPSRPTSLLPEPCDLTKAGGSAKAGRDLLLRPWLARDDIFARQESPTV